MSQTKFPTLLCS